MPGMLKRSGVRSTTKYGCPAYAVKGKVFIFFYGEYGVLRLPRRRVKERTEAGVGTMYRNRQGICPDWLVLEFYFDYPLSEYGNYLEACYRYALGQKTFELWVYSSGY